MKKRSDVKKLDKRWKITDGITKANISLISDLNKDARITGSSAFYFNGSGMDSMETIVSSLTFLTILGNN